MGVWVRDQRKPVYGTRERQQGYGTWAYTHGTGGTWVWDWDIVLGMEMRHSTGYGTGEPGYGNET